jgi:hypothetical protein
MKTILKLLLLFTIIGTIKVTGQGIIIDHACTDLTQIPEAVINDIKNEIKLHYCGQSHSWQISSHDETTCCGLAEVKALNPQLYKYEIGQWALPTTPNVLCIYPFCGNYTYVSEAVYLDAGELNQTLSGEPALNVSQFQWCYQLDTWTQAQVQSYLNTMSNYEQFHPNVTFIYTTGNALANGADGYNRHLRNEQIRNFCIANNKVLFDFGDIECWYNGQQSTYTYNGQQIPVQQSIYNGDNCDYHVNGLCATTKAKAEWWMLARLRGWQTGGQSLNIKLFLQGNYTGSGMSTELNSLGLLPLNQPFNIPPINYNGNESVTSIPNTNVVDWVLLELRDAANALSATSSSIVERKAAFILNNGQIVNLDGTSTIPFSQIVNQQLFVVVRNRNHLGIMSSAQLSENSNIYLYDFTTGSDKAYGGSNSQIELSAGVWGMISGDGNLDGVIDNDDKTLTWTTNSGDAGYYSGDFTLDGNVNNQDKNLMWVPNFGKISYIP